MTTVERLTETEIESILTEHAEELGLDGIPDEIDWNRCGCELCVDECKAEIAAIAKGENK